MRHCRAACRSQVCLLVVALAFAGCLGPLVEDTLPTSVLPSGSEVPSLLDRPELAAQLDEYSPLGGDGANLGFTSGFRDTAPFAYWDFGPAVATPLPLYVLVDYTGAWVQDHPPIVDAVWGDPGYQPLCTIYHVRVGPNYVGQRMASFEAVRDAQQAFPPIVAAPVSTDEVIACPIVHPGASLSRPGKPDASPTVAYYRGVAISVFAFTGQPLGTVADVAAAPQGGYLLSLRREGGEPLSEPHRRVDMTGDGDRRDTNNIVFAKAGAGAGTGVLRRLSVVVAADYGSIDTSGDDAVADFTAGAQLFAPESLNGTGNGDIDALEPVVGNVVAWEPGDAKHLVVSVEALP